MTETPLLPNEQIPVNCSEISAAFITTFSFFSSFFSFFHIEKGLTALKPSQDMEQFLVLSVLTTRMEHVNDGGQLLLFLPLVAAANHTNQRLPVPWERSEGSGL